MATELGKAFVQIVPSAQGISGSISSALGGEATSAGRSAGLNIASAIKGVIAAAGIGTAIKSSLEAGGDLQQSFGGLDTLYGEAAEAAKNYAAEAYKAGINANSYAEQAVSFGASLKQAFGGDTVAAAEAANTAIMDMADNAAKMGTPIENIQNAYQSFARGQYQLLDNLKLGYGGTQAEMSRLLADAQEISGVEYDISNLGDVYAAIHVIQEDLGLTGVAAEEASQTFTGSLAAMKAAGTNLLADLSLGEDIGPSLDALSETINSFVFNNLFPMIGNILTQLPELMSGVSSIIIGSLNMVTNNADQIAQMGIDIVVGLVESIVQALPYLAEAAVNLALALGNALINTDWISIGTSLIESLKSSIDVAAGEILGADTGAIDGFLSGITAALPGVLSKGIEIITNLANGIMQNLPQLITTAGSLISQFASFVMQNYPTILQAGANLLLNLVNGIVSNLPQIVSSVVQVIGKFTSTILSNLPQILQQGILIIGKLAAGLIQAIPQVVAAIPQIINSIKNAFTSVDWGSVGRNLIQGIANGLAGSASMIVDAAKNAAQAAFNAAKSFLGINSPATKGIWLGDMYDEGVAVGVEDNAGKIAKATNSMMDDAFGALTAPQAQFDFGSDQSSSGQLVLNMTINGAEGQDINALAEIIQNKINNAVRSKELAYA